MNLSNEKISLTVNKDYFAYNKTLFLFFIPGKAFNKSPNLHQNHINSIKTRVVNMK